MLIRIDVNGTAVLHDESNFRALKIICSRSLVAPKEALRAIGHYDDAGHLWIDPRWFRDRVLNRSEQWDTGFNQMLAYATGAGWVSDSGAVRAHVEFGD
jgi:hypothetical protein